MSVARPVAVAVSLAAAVMTTAGCNSRPTAAQTAAAVKDTDPADELTQSVRDELRQSADQATCRRVVDVVNSYLPRLPADRRPAALSAAEKTVLDSELGLRPEEVAEVARGEFTTVDAYYLEESFLFRDIARSLDVDRLPPVERATAAIGWVVRNLRGAATNGPAFPPGFVATRGMATPVERTYALLTLLRQLDVDAALVGDPGAGPDGVWAVGVLVDGQVYLIDARLGLPLPGPDGKGVLTLAQARTAADPFHPLAIDPKLTYDVTADRAKRVEVLVSAPLSSLSPRMRFLQGLLLEGTARLTVDPAGLRDRFRKAAGDGGPAVRLWCPPAPDALPRVLFAIVPATEGGGDASPPGQRRIEKYMFGQVPFDLFPQFLRQLTGEPANRVAMDFIQRVMILYEPGQARDLILRGRFREATDKLVAVQERAKRRPANPKELETTTLEWADAARTYYAEESRQKQGRGDPAGAARMADARERMTTLWTNIHGPQAYLNHLTADELAAQSTYLLGMCKQEEAERLAYRRESAGNAQPAWGSAQRWWTSFVTNYPNRPEVPAARRNLARTLAAAGKKAEAKAAFEALATSTFSPLEKLACRYSAESLK